MFRTILAATPALALSAGAAAAAVTVHTNAFIDAPAHYNGFEGLEGNPLLADVEGEGALFWPGQVPYSEGGLTVAFSAPSYIFVHDMTPTWSGGSGEWGMYGAANDGFFRITLTSGEAFQSFQAQVGNGALPGQDLTYRLYRQGELVLAGTTVLPAIGSYGWIGFSGGGFDEIQLSALWGERENFLAIDSLSANPAAVPAPATWALLIGGFGLAGSALRRRRAIA